MMGSRMLVLVSGLMSPIVVSLTPGPVSFKKRNQEE